MTVFGYLMLISIDSDDVIFLRFLPGGGGGTPLYRLYNYVFFGCVGHK